MESYTKSFVLQTPFNRQKAPSVFSEDVSQKSKLKNTHAYNIKSKSYAGEGTFADVLEYNKHLAALRDLEKLKNQYYDEYVEKLERKVSKQRKHLQKKDASTENGEYGHKLPLKTNKLPHHRLRHDRDYMQKVTKSRFYHLLAARDLMQRRGLIKNRTDEDIFWERALHDNHIWSNPLPSGLPADTVTRVMANRFSSMSTYKKQRDNQHVTFGDSPSRSNKISGNETDPDEILNQKLKKFKVKMKLPKLHSLRNITPLPPITPSSKNIPDTEKKLRRLEKLRSTKHAYDLAMVHHALTRRMIHEHDLLAQKESKFLLHDILPSIEDVSKREREDDQLQHADKIEEPLFITEPVYGNDQVLIPDLEYKYASGHVSPKKDSKLKKKSGSRNGSEGEKKIKLEDTVEQTTFPHRNHFENAIPLNYTMMLEKSNLKVRESKSLSSMWVNYLDFKDNAST
ncbi:uncharacterized protein LOC120333210 [Styela clava]